MSNDYKKTVFLPKTTFPMKANLPSREPFILDHWQSMSLYEKLRQESRGKPKFILHDGPPYANGHLHLGHALNKILKDIILKAYQLRGYDTPFIPGWDCHGLPIEWQMEEKLRKKGKAKETMPIPSFRRACREEATYWIDVQKKEALRLGILGDWENPYTTLSHEAEASIVEELMKFVMNGDIYVGEKPIMWSVVEKTALAEAEIDYKEKTSNSIYVKFPISSTSQDFLKGVSAAVWTTTPWTLPGNRAVAYAMEASYVVIEVIQSEKQNLDQDGVKGIAGALVGDRLLVAEDLLDHFVKTNNITKHRVLHKLIGSDLSSTMAAHPLKNQEFGFDVPFLPGKHVTLDQGTGLVHTAPGHGEEDFKLGKDYALEIPKILGDDGVFFDHIPLVNGIHVFKADPIILQYLSQADNLLSVHKIVHSYPHSWRSKAPLIYRTTPQWFMSMEKNGLREKVLKAIDTVKWIPEQSKNRIKSMVESRPDWCLSRQRFWGVPLPFFTHNHTGDILCNQEVNQRILNAVRQHGTDILYEKEPMDFLEGLVTDPSLYTMSRDIVDVWFDSGCTHAFVLEKHKDLTWPADLYVEGSDQHRGWFQSSLFEAVGTRGCAPFKSVLTHGFVLDDKGLKMSKSVGNVVSLDTILKEHGADILRLWVVNSDYREDLRIGKDILRSQQDLYRRFRNTFRYLLGSLDGFNNEERLPYEDLPELEHYILSRLYNLSQKFDQACSTFNFQEFLVSIHTFCSVDLSAFYFDIRKDSLYCDAKDSIRRRAARTIMNEILYYLTRWMAPILSFTAEEVYLSWMEQQNKNSAKKSIFQETVKPAPVFWESAELDQKWQRLRRARRIMTGALEKARHDGLIGSSLQAEITLYGAYEHLQYLEGIDLTELAIVSQASLMEGPVPEEAFVLPDDKTFGVIVNQAKGKRCERCWNISHAVGLDKKYQDVCPRCADVVKQQKKV